MTGQFTDLLVGVDPVGKSGTSTSQSKACLTRVVPGLVDDRRGLLGCVRGPGLVRRGAPCVDQLGGGDLQVAPWHGPVHRRAKDVANLVCREKLSGGSHVLL